MNKKNHWCCLKQTDVFIWIDSTCPTSCHDEKKSKRKKIWPEFHTQLKTTLFERSNGSQSHLQSICQFPLLQFGLSEHLQSTQHNFKLVTAFAELQSNDHGCSLLQCSEHRCVDKAPMHHIHYSSCPRRSRFLGWPTLDSNEKTFEPHAGGLRDWQANGRTAARIMRRRP